MMWQVFKFYMLCGLFLCSTNCCRAQSIKNIKAVFVDSAWAKNSINTVVFRKNALCTFNNIQYISFYNKDGFVVLGKRKVGNINWELQTTTMKGNVNDAHNAISIITDGDGYLHIAWNHHNNALHYCKSTAPGSLNMTNEISMTGSKENNVTYPEFYLLPNGNLLFFYRDGQSGQGNLVINRYQTNSKKWEQLHAGLIDGEQQRNAYWQACVDVKGTIHLSWVWRETADVASNHDLCYAKSTDGGLTWMKSNNQLYTLPITASTAEYILLIPQKSELINQTGMSADEEGNPVIASYWKDKADSVPQYHIAYKLNNEWKVLNTGFRKTVFSLSGAGTKRIPVSRPQIVQQKKGNTNAFLLIFRDEERGSKASIAICNNSQYNNWQITDLTATSVGSWEPAFDTELWKNKKRLHLFVQHTQQTDAEGITDLLPHPVYVLEVKIKLQ